MVEIDKNVSADNEASEQPPVEEAAKELSESPENEPERSHPRSGSNTWVLLLIGLIVGGLAGFSLRPLVFPEEVTNAAPAPLAVEGSAPMNEAEPHQQVMMAVIANARHFYGDPNAPITLVEFGDFNCGYCGRWANETLPLIDENYIKTGKVRMAYVHYPILGADSMTAAEGTECAAQQDKFWEYHNLTYANQGIGYTPTNLTKLAEELGLDKAAFASCMTNFKDRQSLEDDIRLAQVMGVRGTPAFLVNGVPLAGAYPYEDFVTVIEGLLEGKF